MIEILCPKCGSYEVIVEEEGVSLFQSILSFLTLGFYNPWNRHVDDSINNFSAGMARATCLVCAHRFKVFDKSQRTGIDGYSNISPETEEDLAAYEEREQEVLNNHPPI